jgi:signal transduction histidine kinase
VQAALEESERSHAVLGKQSRRMEERLRHLSRRLLNAQEEERVRISHDLHDAIGQTLAGINVGLATLQQELMSDSKDLAEGITMTQALVERSMNTVHEFARELRPTVLDDLGLVPALRSHTMAFAKRTGVDARFAGAADSTGLCPESRIALFRVAQEALANVARHARATTVSVVLRRMPTTLRLEVRDDGQSFDVARVGSSRKNRHLGLLGMQERMDMVGGTFSVESVSGKGTTVRADVPLATDARDR